MLLMALASSSISSRGAARRSAATGLDRSPWEISKAERESTRTRVTRASSDGSAQRGASGEARTRRWRSATQAQLESAP